MRKFRRAAILAVVFGVAMGTARMAQTHDHGAINQDDMLASVEHGVAPKGEVVTYQSGPEMVVSELFLPPSSKRVSTRPAVILIHEWWGLNDWVRQQAQTFAEAGYVTLAVDLYRGQVASDPMTAHELMRGVPQDRARRDLVAAYTYLRGRKDVGASGKVGVVGWCMGGGYAIDFATVEPGLSAVVVNYGSLPTDGTALGRITAPVLGNFGALDKGIPPSTVAAFQQQMKSLGKPVDIKEYPDAAHAFENQNNTTGYNAADAADAKTRTMTFLYQHLMH